MQQQLKFRSKGTKPRRVAKNSVSAFISKTYEFLEDNQFPEIVDWNFEGTSIVIKNPVEFAQKVLNQYFKHKNLTSFVRQLNMYGFHKQRTHKVEYVYSHELFQREKKHLLDQIKRKNQDQISIDSSDTVTEPESDISSPDLSTLMQEKQALKRYNNQAYDKITRLEGKVKDLMLQNQALKDQVSQQGEKDKILISLMASILQKYGIPPNELSSIMKKDLEEPLMQSLSSCQLQNRGLSVNSSKNPECEGDISTFLNFEADMMNFKTASVLNDIANFDDRNNIHRDISPYPRVNTVEPDFQWDSSFGQKHYLSNFGNKEERKEAYFHCTPMKTQSTTIPFYGTTESNLVKRRFEEENNFGGYGAESYETIKKKFEVAPSVPRSDETYYYMSGQVDDGRRKSRSNEDLFDPNYFNFTQTVWI